MSKFTRVLLFALVCQISLSAEEGGHCRKCEIMRDYNSKHPSKYQYYEDYLKDLEEKGADAVNPSSEDLPPDVKFIMGQEKETLEKTEKKKS
jgi:hypothetical protein